MLDEIVMFTKQFPKNNVTVKVECLMTALEKLRRQAAWPFVPSNTNVKA
jgi:hypothetical protein